MTKTAKVAQIEYEREWAGPNGMVYYHALTLDNGDHGKIGTKEKLPAKLSVGSEITYTIKETGDYKGHPQYKITLEVARTFQGGGTYRTPEDPQKQTNIARSVALNNAVTLYSRLMPVGMYNEYEIVKTALYFQHYLETGENLAKEEYENNKDLPF